MKRAVPPIASFALVLTLASACAIGISGYAYAQGPWNYADNPMFGNAAALPIAENENPLDWIFGFLFGKSPANNDSSSGAPASDAHTSESTPTAGSSYDSEYFKVTLPKSWGNDWLVDISEDKREAMNASNFAYTFKLNGSEQFTLECKVFSLNDEASVGKGERQVEFYPAKGLASEDESFIRSHIEVKKAQGTEGTDQASNDWLFSKPIKSESDAVNRIHDLLMRAGKPVDCKFDFVRMTDDGRYVVRGYEVVNDGSGSSHEATWYLYSIGEDVSVYDELLLREVDPASME